MPLLVLILILFSFEASPFSLARERIHVVGSSVVYPFITRIAEEFGRNSIFASPYVESSSTGAGFSLFCRSKDKYIANVLVASRQIRASESSLCAGTGELIELKIGYDGLIIANSKNGPAFNLTQDHIFKAVAAKIVKDGNIVANFYSNWSQIDHTLPDRRIEIYGPPSGSGTRDIFLNLIFLPRCVRMKEFQMDYPRLPDREERCRKLRHDGFFIEAAENDSVVIRKLISNTNALGIVSFSFLEQNSEDIKANLFGGVMPTKENILSGKYSLTRPLYVYIKKDELDSIIGLKDFIKEIISDAAIAPGGYLSDTGFISLNDKERVKLKEVFGS